MDLKYLFSPTILVSQPIKDSQGREYYDYKWGLKEVAVTLLEGIEDIDFGKVILAAGADRNIVVYDQYDHDNKVTSRLLQLMQFTQIEDQDRPIDFFFYPAGSLYTFPDYRFIAIEREEYNQLKDYYLNDLQASFGPGDYDFVIGISLRKGNMVNPTYKDKQGIAIMDNSCILLGSF